MQSKATTVDQYLKSLPSDRREAITTVRKLILKHLDKGFKEGMLYGMIGYYVPHSIFPAGYHCDPSKPLCFAGLASQKNYMSLYLLVYGQEGKWFTEEWAKTGKKLDMGKCCIRFKKVEDLALDVVVEVFRRYTAKRYVEYYESARQEYQEYKAKHGSARPKKSTPVRKGVKPAKAVAKRAKKK